MESGELRTYLEHVPLDIFNLVTSRFRSSRIEMPMTFFQYKVQVLEWFPLNHRLHPYQSSDPQDSNDYKGKEVREWTRTS